MKLRTPKSTSPKSVKPKRRKKVKTPATVTTTTPGLHATATSFGRVVALGLLLLLVVGSGLGAYAALRSPTVEAASAPEDQTTAQEQQAAAYASNLVGAWLSATTDDTDLLEELLPGSGGAIKAEKPTEYRDLNVASIETDEQNLSTVTLSATVKITEGEGEDKTERWMPQWFQVAVTPTENPVALGLPAAVERPETGDKPQLGYKNTLTNTDATKTVQEFMTAYVTGQGDVTRFTSPTSSIHAITPTPYTKASVGEIAIVEKNPTDTPSGGTELHALVPVTLNSATGERQAEYALTLTTRDGRWEIQSIDPRPLIGTN